MIYGIGIDIVNIQRFKNTFKKYSKKFLDKIFTKDEILIANSYIDPSLFLAGRWASKEALSKALGIGICKNCQWLDISILKDINGKPYISLAGKTKEYINNIGINNILISISHEREYIIANVILEK